MQRELFARTQRFAGNGIGSPCATKPSAPRPARRRRHARCTDGRTHAPRGGHHEHATVGSTNIERKPLGGSQAAVVPDFSMEANESQRVVRTMRLDLRSATRTSWRARFGAASISPTRSSHAGPRRQCVGWSSTLIHDSCRVSNAL
jgi:hypothetical protein